LQVKLRATSARRPASFSASRQSRPSDIVYVPASQYALSLLHLERKEATRQEFVEIFSGNRHLPGTRPAAHNYAGHQFGSFSGQLGDGACLYLGEVVLGMRSGGEGLKESSAERAPRLELQLKGAGKTPYSRGGDGRKALRAVVREFLLCEALHHLGVPTVRALAVISSSTAAVRDDYYTGENVEQRCGVLARVASTFLRFGSFEIFRNVDPVTAQAGPSAGLALEQVELGVVASSRAKFLPAMVQLVSASHFPAVEDRVHACLQEEGLTGNDASSDARASVLRSRLLLRDVVHRTAALAAQWSALGFCHGLLNTDNMSIVGMTLDCGASSFLDIYDPAHCPCVTDDANRYSFEAQEDICKWNCVKLAEALAPVLPPQEGFTIVVEEYDAVYRSEWLRLYRSKLGLGRVMHLRETLLKCEQVPCSALLCSALLCSNLISDCSNASM